jgi:hypothetical protein
MVAVPSARMAAPSCNARVRGPFSRIGLCDWCAGATRLIGAGAAKGALVRGRGTFTEIISATLTGNLSSAPAISVRSCLSSSALAIMALCPEDRVVVPVVTADWSVLIIVSSPENIPWSCFSCTACSTAYACKAPPCASNRFTKHRDQFVKAANSRFHGSSLTLHPHC